MSDGNSMLKKLNLLGSKAKEIINTNKILTNEISYYQKLFSSNKDYITLYFNLLSEFKKKTTNSNNNNKTNHLNNVKNIMIKYHSEIKDLYSVSKENLKNSEQKHELLSSKLNSDIEKLEQYHQKISEDNFLYSNTIQSKENFIVCLKKDLVHVKKNIFEDIRHIYLNYNFQNIINQNQTNITKNDNNVSFEEGETEIKDLLTNARRKFILDMKMRNNLRLQYRKKSVKKNALNDLVTSISFINKTEITPSKNNNIFQVLNKKIGGIVKDYERYFNEDEEIDENFFIFLPFELEINRDEINELVQTDITLPNKKLQSKSINEYKLKKKTHTKNKSFIDVPKLNFLQIEFNKEKISYSEDSGDQETNEKKNDTESKAKDIDNKNDADNNDSEKKIQIKTEGNKEKNDKDKNKVKNKKEDLDLKIKQMKSDIRNLKKKNRKMKAIINDFEKFQDKIQDKFIIYEKMMLNKKEQNSKLDVEDLNKIIGK
jgi:hypothetical protein